MISIQDKIDALKKLYNEYADCSPCTFGKTEANHRVFGTGNPNAALMLIGEAPGAEEDRLKKPFVGRSGKLLDKICKEYGIEREALFITNAVKCRPFENRTPLPHEIDKHLKTLLKKEITIVAPYVICTLGSIATRLFSNSTDPISKLRGHILEFPRLNLIVIPTFHPAYALRNPEAEKLLYQDILTAWNLSKKAQTEKLN